MLSDVYSFCSYLPVSPGSGLGILLSNLLFKYLTYYFGNFSYPIIYPIVTFTYRKVKNYPIKNFGEGGEAPLPAKL